MSSFAKPVSPSKERIPPLYNGDHLTVDEFIRRYEAMPGYEKAELIEGIVYMAPPVSHREHSVPHFDIIGLLSVYKSATPGVVGGDNGSLRLDTENMPQPDAYLFVSPDCGGSVRIGEDRYVHGAPDLVVEIAGTSANFDLNSKLQIYLRNGVREYIVWRTFDRAIDYFLLRGSEYVRQPADELGRFRSEAFPGLWIDTNNLLNDNLAAAMKFLHQGLATPEHAAFVAKLQQAANPK
jgi:Uma2 family endonuclease